VGAKSITGITGLLLFGFLVGHMSGNLLMFAGRDAFNEYAHRMQSLGPLLWLMRGGLLAVFIVHFATALRLARANRGARPVKYACMQTVQASFASRTMVLSGLVILFFVLFHLSHFTLHWIGAEYGHYTDEIGRHDAYRMVIEGFMHPLNSGLYIAAMLTLGLHLSHGLANLWQSLGLNHPHLNHVLRKGLPALGWLIILGFISIPVSVLTGIVRL
jgi:succinate dehydrogenase / fumarate reductase cytochrome b subunit